MVKPTELKIARSKISYGAMRDYNRAESELLQAAMKGDLEAQEAAREKMDSFVYCFVESVPEDWFVDDAPEAARAMGDGWLDWVRQDHIREIRMEMIGVPRDQEKKASAIG